MAEKHQRVRGVGVNKNWSLDLSTAIQSDLSTRILTRRHLNGWIKIKMGWLIAMIYAKCCGGSGKVNMGILTCWAETTWRCVRLGLGLELPLGLRLGSGLELDGVRVRVRVRVRTRVRVRVRRVHVRCVLDKDMNDACLRFGWTMQSSAPMRVNVRFMCKIYHAANSNPEP